MISDARYHLSENHELNYTEQRKTRGVDRAWRESEVKHAVELAHSMSRYDVKCSIQLARTYGLLIEEVTALTRTQLRNALDKDYLALKTTKGGIPRDIPLTSNARNVCKRFFHMRSKSAFSSDMAISITKFSNPYRTGSITTVTSSKKAIT
jgi:hypothetical protein